MKLLSFNAREATLSVVLFLLFRINWAVRLSTFSLVASHNRNPETSKTFNDTSSNPRKTIITFVNGIYHSYDECQEIASLMEEIFKDEVRPFYNPSSGRWLYDLTHAGFALFKKPNDLYLARNLAKHLRKALKDVGISGRILHLAHSGGAILTYLAARNHLSRNETSRIDVAVFGGGRSITRKYFSGRVVNYYAKNDPLLLVDQRASQLSKLAARMPLNSTMFEVQDKKHNTTFVFLKGLANNPVMDHSMNGPTYAWAMRLEADEYKKRLNELSTFNANQRFWMRLTRKRIAQTTGLHHFWDEITPSIRGMRKISARLTNTRGYFSRKGRDVISNFTVEVNDTVIEIQTKGKAIKNITTSNSQVIMTDTESYTLNNLTNSPGNVSGSNVASFNLSANSSLGNRDNVVGTTRMSFTSSWNQMFNSTRTSELWNSTTRYFKELSFGNRLRSVTKRREAEGNLRSIYVPASASSNESMTSVPDSTSTAASNTKVDIAATENVTASTIGSPFASDVVLASDQDDDILLNSNSIPSQEMENSTDSSQFQSSRSPSTSTSTSWWRYSTRKSRPSGSLSSSSPLSSWQRTKEYFAAYWYSKSSKSSNTTSDEISSSTNNIENEDCNSTNSSSTDSGNNSTDDSEDETGQRVDNLVMGKEDASVTVVRGGGGIGGEMDIRNEDDALLVEEEVLLVSPSSNANSELAVDLESEVHREVVGQEVLHDKPDATDGVIVDVDVDANTDADDAGTTYTEAEDGDTEVAIALSSSSSDIQVADIKDSGVGGSMVGVRDDASSENATAVAAVAALEIEVNEQEKNRSSWFSFLFSPSKSHHHHYPVNITVTDQNIPQSHAQEELPITSGMTAAITSNRSSSSSSSRSSSSHDINIHDDYSSLMDSQTDDDDS